MSPIPVVFVPGLAADIRLWQPVIDRLGGLIDPIAARVDADSIADIGAEILESAPARFYIAGTSMGGYVALDVALRHDPRLAGVVLTNTSASSANAIQQQVMGERLEKAARSWDEVSDGLGAGVAGGDPERAALATRMARDVGLESFLRQQTAVLERRDRRDQLASITVPTLLIAGDDDKLTPPSALNEIARKVPNVSLEILPRTGHLATLEAPDAVADLIRAFLIAHEGPQD